MKKKRRYCFQQENLVRGKIYTKEKLHCLWKQRRQAHGIGIKERAASKQENTEERKEKKVHLMENTGG